MKTRIFAMIVGIIMFFRGESAAQNENVPMCAIKSAEHETFFSAGFVKTLSERQRILIALKDSSMEKIIDLPMMTRSEKMAVKWFVSRIEDIPVEIIAGMIPIAASQQPIFIDFKIASDGVRLIGISLFIAFDEKKEFVVPVIIQTFNENEAYDDKQYAEQRRLLGILHPRIGEVIAWTAENAEKILREALVKMEIASNEGLARLIPPHQMEKEIKT